MGCNGGCHCGPSLAPQSRIVLNALRHQRRFHETAADVSVNFSMCSTPYGINEDFTRIVVLHDVQHKCSTPYGINEDFTRFAAKPFQFLKVLNALRHQRRFHQEVGSIGSRLCFAQRLTASTKISHPVYLSPLPVPGSAQRLTASTKISREYGLRPSP